jgi:hypothetical protein
MTTPYQKYLSASRKAAIVKKVRIPSKISVDVLLDEIDAAIESKTAEPLAALALTPSVGYTAAELKSVADKVDGLMAELQKVGLMKPTVIL